MARSLACESWTLRKRYTVDFTNLQSIMDSKNLEALNNTSNFSTI